MKICSGRLILRLLKVSLLVSCSLKVGNQVLLQTKNLPSKNLSSAFSFFVQLLPYKL